MKYILLLFDLFMLYIGGSFFISDILTGKFIDKEPVGIITITFSFVIVYSLILVIVYLLESCRLYRRRVGIMLGLCIIMLILSFLKLTMLMSGLMTFASIYSLVNTFRNWKLPKEA